MTTMIRNMPCVVGLMREFEEEEDRRWVLIIKGGLTVLRSRNAEMEEW